MKPFFASKLNWLGFLVFLAGLDKLVTQLPVQLPADWLPWIALIAGVATMVLRTFFTSTAISGK